MAHTVSAPGSVSRVLRSRLTTLVLAGAAGLSAASAQAGVLSVVTEQANGIVTFNIFDSNPLDMCDGGVCFADFAIDFNPAELEFVSGATLVPSFFEAGAALGGPKGAQVFVSLLPDDEAALGGSNLLFSLGFKALVTQQVALTVGPREFPVPMPYQPAPVNVSVPVGAVPEPASLLMASIGLAGLVWSRRQSGKQQGA